MLYKIPVDILTSSASRALGSVIAKFKTFKDVVFDTFNKKIILWWSQSQIPISASVVMGISQKQLILRIEQLAIS